MHTAPQLQCNDANMIARWRITYNRQKKRLALPQQPTCTLSQYGYGENNEAIWLETTLKGASHAMVKVKGYLAMLRCKRARIKKFAKQGK